MSDKTIVACLLAGCSFCVVVLVAVMLYSHSQLFVLSGGPIFTTPERGMIETYGGARIGCRSPAKERSFSRISTS